MSAEALLARLDKVKRVGAGKYTACCPAHPDKSPSLSIAEKDDGRVLLHCFAGCSVPEILGAVSVDMAELFPPRPLTLDRLAPERHPWVPSDVFGLARFEISITALIASDMHKDRAISEEDYARLLLAARRLDHIAEAAYGSR